MAGQTKDDVDKLTSRASASILGVVDRVELTNEEHDLVRRAVLDAMELMGRRFRDLLGAEHGIDSHAYRT